MAPLYSPFYQGYTVMSVIEKNLPQYILKNVEHNIVVNKAKCTIYKTWSDKDIVRGRVTFFVQDQIVSYFFQQKNDMVSCWKTRKVTEEPDFTVSLEELCGKK